MIVVSDTGPIQYLVLVEAVHLLPVFYSEVVIPAAVIEEFQQQTTPKVVQAWVSNLPSWATIRHAEHIERLPFQLGRGETEAIALATELDGLLLLDDQDARRVAAARSIPTTGTLGVLLRAHVEGLLDIEISLARLQKTNFYLKPDLRDHILRQAKKV